MTNILTIVLTVLLTCTLSRIVNDIFDALRDNRGKRTSAKRVKRGGRK